MNNINDYKLSLVYSSPLFPLPSPFIPLILIDDLAFSFMGKKDIDAISGDFLPPLPPPSKTSLQLSPLLHFSVFTFVGLYTHHSSQSLSHIN